MKIQDFSDCVLYQNRYNPAMKPIVFLGDALERMRDFPITARREAGFQLDKVQRGLSPDDFKPMTTIGKGVQEIRLKDSRGIYRVVYIAKFENAVYVLHAFQKKTQQTAKTDIDLAKKRLTELARKHKS
jgi:phage-related protein